MHDLFIQFRNPTYLKENFYAVPYPNYMEIRRGEGVRGIEKEGVAHRTEIPGQICRGQVLT